MILAVDFEDLKAENGCGGRANEDCCPAKRINDEIIAQSLHTDGPSGNLNEIW